MNYFRLWLATREQIRLTWKLLWDSRVPKWQKAIPILPIIYIVSPLNLATLAIPVLGSIEGVFLFTMTMRLFIHLVDDEIVLEYQGQKELATDKSERESAPFSI